MANSKQDRNEERVSPMILHTHTHTHTHTHNEAVNTNFLKFKSALGIKTPRAFLWVNPGSFSGILKDLPGFFTLGGG